jgi:hypothetical protein
MEKQLDRHLCRPADRHLTRFPTPDCATAIAAEAQSDGEAIGGKS